MKKRGIAVEHADITAQEGGEGVLPVEFGRRDRAGQGRYDQVVLDPAERLRVLLGRDAVPAASVGVPAAVAQFPDQGFGVGLLLAILSIKLRTSMRLVHFR